MEIGAYLGFGFRRRCRCSRTASGSASRIASMILSKVGSVARAPGRTCSTRRICSASIGGFGFRLSGIAPSLSARLGGLAEAVPSAATSATRYDLPEGIGIVPVVVPELKFIDVERHVGAADVVEIADDPALEHRPEAFNRVRVHDTADVLALGVAHDRVREFFADVAV